MTPYGVQIGDRVYEAGQWIDDSDVRYVGNAMKIQKPYFSDDAFFNAVLDSQINKESLGVQNIVSHAGAKGLAQFMDGTWADMVRRGVVSEEDSPFDPRASLKAQKAYMQWIYDRPYIANARTAEERLNRTLAAYNTGVGTVRNLIRKHGKRWTDYLPKETKDYLRSITDDLQQRTLSGEYTPVYNRQFS
jgi:soluble lytic murein transglycosylase-like protein